MPETQETGSHPPAGNLDSVQDSETYAAGVTTAPGESVLRKHGLQVTAQRLAVLSAVSGHPHGTAEAICSQVRSQLGSVSRQAVYDALGALTDKGVLRRIQPAGSPARYESRVDDNHHHLICRACAQMVDVDCAVGDTPCLTASDDFGYLIDEAEVVYWGLCPSCASSSKP
jgi:Fur family transcriptional regulator, stress-responsive regulator